MNLRACLAALLVIGTGLTGPSAAQAPPGAASERTIVDDPAALARLRRNSGITLQWIGFQSPARGHVIVSGRGLVHLRGSHAERRGPGRLTLDGDVLRIEARSFSFRGRIVISDTPDRGRNCVRDGAYEFRVTQRRRYWRLQDIEACDGLADYVDIYF
jgi:hypothetical protein